MRTFDWIIVGGDITGISLCEILAREGHSTKVISVLKNSKKLQLPGKQQE